MIRIITMEREYGSGAAATAEKVAARMGWKLIKVQNCLNHHFFAAIGAEHRMIDGTVRHNRKR
jgi:hypothetical protein